MKKKISFVPIDSTLELWLLEKLTKEPPKTDCANELLNGIKDIVSGEVSSLLIGAKDDTPVFPTDNDTMHIGALEIYTKTRKVVMHGKEVSLTPKEYDILYFLVQNRERFLARSKYTRLCGQRIISLMTAILWLSYESYAKRLSQIPMLQNIF